MFVASSGGPGGGSAMWSTAARPYLLARPGDRNHPPSEGIRNRYVVSLCGLLVNGEVHPHSCGDGHWQKDVDVDAVRAQVVTLAAVDGRARDRSARRLGQRQEGHSGRPAGGAGGRG